MKLEQLMLLSWSEDKLGIKSFVHQAQTTPKSRLRTTHRHEHYLVSEGYKRFKPQSGLDSTGDPCLHWAHLGCCKSINMWGRLKKKSRFLWEHQEAISREKGSCASASHITPQSPAGKQGLCFTRWTALAWGLSTSVIVGQKEIAISSSGESWVKENQTTANAAEGPGLGKWHVQA